MKRFLPALMTLVATPALAHTGAGIDHVHAATSGLLHPLTGADHLAAMLAAGAAAAHFTGLGRLAVPAAFLVAMVAGFGLALAGLPLPFVEAMILASVIGLGVLAVVPRRLVTVSLVAAGFAVFHGYAHGTETASADGITFAFGFVASSAMLMAAGTGLASLFRRSFAKV